MLSAKGDERNLVVSHCNAPPAARHCPPCSEEGGECAAMSPQNVAGNHDSIYIIYIYRKGCHLKPRQLECQLFWEVDLIQNWKTEWTRMGLSENTVKQNSRVDHHFSHMFHIELPFWVQPHFWANPCATATTPCALLKLDRCPPSTFPTQTNGWFWCSWGVPQSFRNIYVLELSVIQRGFKSNEFRNAIKLCGQNGQNGEKLRPRQSVLATAIAEGSHRAAATTLQSLAQKEPCALPQAGQN